MHRSNLLPAVAAALALVLPASAQALVLDTVGGSLPGTLSLDLHPGAFPFDACFILTGIDPGPTPIAAFDPADPRSVQVGTSMLSNSFFGLFALDLHFRVGPLPVPALPALVNQPFFFQGVTLPGTTTVVDRISNATAVRMSTAGAFRDRSVFMVEQRAYGTILPRTDQKWMITGGGRGGLLAQVATRTTEIYDDVADAFTYGPSMTTERSIHTQTQLLDGRWLLCGGVDRLNDPQAACEVYDPATDTFTGVAPMLSPRMGHTATLLADGRVLVTGGFAALTVQPTQLQAIHDIVASTEIYNPVANTWTAGPPLRTPRAGHVAIHRQDGKVLLCGGVSWDNIIITWLPAVRATCDLYDPVANTMVAGPGMASAHSLTDAIAIGNDRYLLAGGISALSLTNLGTPTAVAEVYNGATNTWTGANSMATARGNHAVWALGGGRFLHAGGANGTILSPTPLQSTEIWDAATNGWSAGPSLSIPRAGASAYRNPRGQMQLFGGGTAQNTIATSTEWYYF